jgi:YhcN/YlaJ family sporulation lipoprotein
MRNISRITWFIPLLILSFAGCTQTDEGFPQNQSGQFYQGLHQDYTNQSYQERDQSFLGTDLRRMQHDPFNSIDQTVPLADRMRDQNVEMNQKRQQQRSTSENRTLNLDNNDIHHDQTRIQGTKAPQSPNRNKEAQEVADRLVKIATRIEQVNDATAVVIGRWAVVGIDVDAKLDRSKVGTIKYTVAEALKADPKGAYAIITADIDTNYRLREMAKDIRNGKPIEGFMNELAAIIGRIMPQVPRDIEVQEAPKPKKMNK